MTRPTILLETVIRFLEGFEAYGLTDREQQLTRLILRGLPTMATLIAVLVAVFLHARRPQAVNNCPLTRGNRWSQGDSNP
jgi:hypothetical protein